MASSDSDSKISQEDIDALLTKFCHKWAIEELSKTLRIEFSERITRSLGRTQVAARHIRLNPLLKTELKGLLAEVLCHELAHIAAHHLHGDLIRPHGPEWQSLVRVAGFEPKVRLGVDLGLILQNQSKCYTHSCPVCHTKRVAEKPMKRWRCAECVANGLPGTLVIEGEA